MSPGDPFVSEVVRSDSKDLLSLLLFHGTGGDENDLISAGRLIAPEATLIGLRGRSTDEPSLRWFRRFPDGTFDQNQIFSEAEAVTAFLPDLLERESLNIQDAVPLGFSNGANFIGAMLFLYPGLFKRAVLWRPMLVLEKLPEVDLTGTSVLITTGVSDPYGHFVPALADALESRGAKVDLHTLPTGHTLTRSDISITADWLGLN